MMLNLRSYDFDSNIHLFKVRDKNLLLDVNSGALHLIDQAACDYINCLRQADGDWDRAHELVLAKVAPDAASETRKEMEEAMAAGTLFSPEPDLTQIDIDNLVPKAICLNVAHLCDMRCRYCFAQQGSFGRKQMLMSPEVAERTVDFLIEASHGRQQLEMDFFGGEPLLNWDVVKHTVDYGRKRAQEAGKGFSFTLTTNGLGLDREKRDYLKQEQIAVIMSLDGRRSVNDHMRVTPAGGGTYEAVLPNIKAMAAMDPISYYIRGTYTAQNLDFAEDARHLLELGFDNISLEPVVGNKPGLSLKEEHLDQLARHYDQLVDIIRAYRNQGRRVNFFHFNLDLNRGPCVAKRITGCGAGVEYLVVTPEGEIYPCHQFVGVSEFKMGDVQTGFIDPDVRKRFVMNTIINKECKNCWSRFYCGGGCHASAFFVNGKIEKPSRIACLLHQMRLEYAFYLAVTEQGGVQG